MQISAFEDLPPELLIKILEIIQDRGTLKALVLSSHACYRVYCTYRDKLLCSFAANLWGDVLAEAVYVCESEKLLEYRTATQQKAIVTNEVVELLDRWRYYRETAKPAEQDAPTKASDALRLLDLHKEMTYFVQGFSKHNKRPRYVNPHQWQKVQFPVVLSSTEEHRLLRALCRLQLHSNVFAKAPSRSERPFDRYALCSQEVWRLFFATMPPWEYEEMGSVWAYLQTEFDPVLYKIRHEFREHGDELFKDLPEGRRALLGPVYSQGLKLYKSDIDRLTFLSLGPTFLHLAFHARLNIRCSMLLVNSRYEHESWIGHNLNISWEEQVPLKYPADQYNAIENFEQLLTLTSSNSSTRKPNAAWTGRAMGRLKRTQNFKKAFVTTQSRPQPGDWDWGYAIWDDERLEEWRVNFK
ncbi:hypothetical protein N7445_007798 [Penicillium cf. griseofulvum]|nr:hypothetical protein N7445_007798 [Penicillium cf. griseofulvum]